MNKHLIKYELKALVMCQISKCLKDHIHSQTDQRGDENTFYGSFEHNLNGTFVEFLGT